MTLKDFSKKMLRLGEILGEKPSEVKIEGYWEILNGYSDGQLMKALNRGAKECSFFPRPAELIAFIEDIATPQNLTLPTPEDIDWRENYLQNSREIRESKRIKNMCVEVKI